MTVIRDTDFTPSHIIEFYMSYPMYIVVGVGGFMYARTRLPTFALKGWSVAYVLLFVGPFMIFPNVGLNEWGHTFWFMEELFVAPLHWMFVFFGWFSLAVFGVALQILGRVGELCKGYEDLLVSNRLSNLSARGTGVYQAPPLVRPWRCFQGALHLGSGPINILAVSAQGLIYWRREEASPWMICFCFPRRRCAVSSRIFRCRTGS